MVIKHVEPIIRIWLYGEIVVLREMGIQEHKDLRVMFMKVHLTFLAQETEVNLENKRKNKVKERIVRIWDTRW